MDEPDVQHALRTAILSSRPGVKQGMDTAIQTIAATPQGSHWNSTPNIDWERGLDEWIEWMNNLLVQHPMPAETELLWFEIPSDNFPPMTSVSAYARLASESDRYGMGRGRSWPRTADGETLPAGLHVLPELAALFDAAGWEQGLAEDETGDMLYPNVLLLGHAYTLLLVINGLPRTRVLSATRSPHGLAVLMGFVEGGLETVGQLTSSGWGPIRGPDQ